MAPSHYLNHCWGIKGVLWHAPDRNYTFNTLRPRQNGRRFADDTFKRIFLNENVRTSIKISLKFVPKGRINIIPALVQIMAWRRAGDKPLSGPMMVSLLTHICVTRPQWVKPHLHQSAVILIQRNELKIEAWWRTYASVHCVITGLFGAKPSPGSNLTSVSIIRPWGSYWNFIPNSNMFILANAFELVVDINSIYFVLIPVHIHTQTVNLDVTYQYVLLYITMTSHERHGRLVSPAPRLFDQQIIRLIIKENIMTPHYWPFVECIPLTQRQ